MQGYFNGKSESCVKIKCRLKMNKNKRAPIKAFYRLTHDSIEKNFFKKEAD